MFIVLFLGLKREIIGVIYLIVRELNIVIIVDKYGFDFLEGEGVLGVYIVGIVFGIIFIGLFVLFLVVYIFLYLYLFVMVLGVGFVSMMIVFVGVLLILYLDMVDIIVVFGVLSNFLFGFDGVYMFIWIVLFLIEYLYKKFNKEGK